ncbi:MAG TPA: ABC transporter substrate-binding protein, partial [Actinomycetota bacterium]|nr:ABC transporter substrate-binding protein [Actinomycetota bacterium]
TLDPIAPSGGSHATRDILRPVLPALFALDAELRPQPELAAAWPGPDDIRLDPLSVDLELREAAWSDGTPITAADVRFSWERLREGPTGARYRPLRDVEVTGPRTLTLRFDRRVRRWWSLFSIDDMVLPAHAYGPGWENGPTVSAGPFSFEGWERGLSVRLRRNDAHWGTKASAEAIDVTFVEDDETRIVLTERSELDVAWFEGDSNVGARAAARGFEPTDGPALGGRVVAGAWAPAWWELSWDPDRVPRELARGLSAAVDRKLTPELLEDSGQAMDGIPARFPAPQPQRWGLPALPGPWPAESGVDAANRALRDGQYQTGASLRDGRGREVDLRLAHPTGTASAIARFVHWQLRPLGLRLEVIGVQSDRLERDWIPERRTDGYLVLRRAADAPDVDAYRPDAPRPGRVPGIEELAERAGSAVSGAALRGRPVVGLGEAGWAAAQREMAESGYVVPLARVRTWLAVREGLVGPHPVGAASGPLWNAALWGSLGT